ncbi:FtsX-like permease family protein [Rhodocytophaga rosea]|uniref:FtsX-like permease family protein n=1 Tax=Rhodocytophaga rosea TaxID=2704465 RepID=A0A6C0GKG5_9BACT|nr:ABC transporter permease [Rhodocytophaga rosea]QHT68314.1 FtsX-like permease family protein [Rhodocytophaga rosea]
MLKNYITIAVRTLVRQAVFSSVTIIGFSIGMTCVMLISLYVWDELQYDRHHQQHEQIYRVVQQQYFTGTSQALATTSGPVAAALQKDYAEVEKAVRIFIRKNALLSSGERKFYGENVAFTDPSAFKVFTFQFIAGNANDALAQPNTMVLTESTAQKYFGREDPIGKIIKLNNTPYTINGLIKDPPANSHVHFSCLASLVTLEQFPWMQNWGITSLWTYVLVKPQTSIAALEKKLPAFVEKYHGEGYSERISYQLQPLIDIHLYSNMAGEIEPNGNILFVKIFAAIAIFILLLACINYINLSTARATERMKEVGLRKMVGAHRFQVASQFLIEAVITSLLAFVMAVLLFSISLPVFNQLTGKAFSWYTLDSNMILVSLIIFILAGLISGLYPAFYLSSFRLVNAFKSNVTHIRTGLDFRKVLVVVQFTVSVVLLIATFIAYQQLQYIQSSHLGFDKEHLINVKVRDAQWRGKSDLLKQQLSTVSGVAKVAASLNFMGEELDGSDVRPAGTPEEATKLLAVTFVDYDFIETMQMQMAAGRAFSNQFAGDTSAAFIINEAAVKAFGWSSAEEAIGKELEYLGGERMKEPVIGVVKDFHFASLHQQVQPLLLMCWPSRLSSLSIKLRSGDPAITLAELDKKWQSLSPDFPFEYQFADDAIDKLYQSDQRAGQLFAVFAALAIGIACLGLFGMTVFTARKRIKEIGVRKVLGASINQIILLLCKDFISLVLISILIAAPIAWYGMHQWLNNFAFHIEINIIPFIIAGAIASSIALLTISHQAIKAALANPVNSLRNE